MPLSRVNQITFKHLELDLYMVQGIQEWTKQNFLKVVFHKFYLGHS